MLSNTEIKEIVKANFPDETDSGIIIDRVINCMSWAYIFDKYSDGTDYGLFARKRFMSNVSRLLGKYNAIVMEYGKENAV